MIGVVIDTGIVVSAAFRDRVPEELILFVVETDGVLWIASSAILDEYYAVLAREKLGYPRPYWNAGVASSLKTRP
jgi:predicted nucleic acid-binding protein